MTTTKTKLIEVYEKELVKQYSGEGPIDGWAKDADRLRAFMERVKETLNGPYIVVNLTDSPAFIAACKEVGLAARVTYKELRTLPE